MAEALKPYTLYLIYGQILLLSLAILVGATLIIRRLWKRESVDGGLIQDREKLAAEIHEEVLRLQDLRNRLDSSYIIEGKDISASPVPAVLKQGAPAATAETHPMQKALSQIELEEKVHAATQALTGEIAQLTQKLAQTEEKLKAALANPAASSGPSSAEAEAVVAELKGLKEKLEDYQAFEDEIALVKQYKEENERLKAQLAAGGGAPVPAEKISEDDIASLFAEMGSSSEETAPIPEATVAASEPQAEPEVDPLEALLAQEPAAEATAPEVAPSDLDALLASTEASTAVESAPELAADESDAPPRKGYVPEAQTQEPTLAAVNEDNAEALAELGEDDQLMAEFEKVLGTKGPEKNS